MQQYSKTTYTEIDTPYCSTAVDEEMQQYTIGIQEPMANDIDTLHTDLSISAEEPFLW